MASAISAHASFEKSKTSDKHMLDGTADALSGLGMLILDKFKRAMTRQLRVIGLYILDGRLQG